MKDDGSTSKNKNQFIIETHSENLLLRAQKCLRKGYEFEGKKINTTVSSLDLYPTILELLDLSAPENIIGKSWVPLFNNNEKNNKENYDKRFHRSDSRMHFQNC